MISVSFNEIQCSKIMQFTQKVSPFVNILYFEKNLCQIFHHLAQKGEGGALVILLFKIKCCRIVPPLDAVNFEKKVEKARGEKIRDPTP